MFTCVLFFFWMFYCPGGLVEVSGFYPPLLLPCFVLPPGCWAKFKIAASNCHLFVTRIGWSWIVFQLPDVSQLSLKLVDLELCRSAFRCLSIVTQICWFWIGLQLQIVTRLSLVCHSIWLILNCFSASRCLVICHSDWSWMFFRFSYAFLSMVGHSNVFQLVLHMFFICPSNSSYSWWLGPISMPMVEIVVRALSEWHWWTWTGCPSWAGLRWTINLWLQFHSKPYGRIMHVKRIFFACSKWMFWGHGFLQESLHPYTRQRLR